VITDRNKRNLGFDPIEAPPPAKTFSFSPAAAPTASGEDFQREIIDFDSESPAGLQFLSFTTATGLSRFTEIPWPARLAPKTGPKPRRCRKPMFCWSRGRSTRDTRSVAF
jgi:hypothetical protein